MRWLDLTGPDRVVNAHPTTETKTQRPLHNCRAFGITKTDIVSAEDLILEGTAGVQVSFETPDFDLYF
jgi:hypothetical protein